MHREQLRLKVKVKHKVLNGEMVTDKQDYESGIRLLD